MGGVVVFDPVAFKAEYPRFAGVPDAALNRLFRTACLLVDNTPGSPIPLTGPEPLPEPRRELLYLAVAHMQELENRGMDTVGRVASAAQGSVNVSFETLGGSDAAQWWQQTQYGALFWRASLPYRMGPLYVV